MIKKVLTSALLLAGMLRLLPAQAQTHIHTIKVGTANPNATGIQLGFWENNKEPTTLAKMGKRPTSRVGFNSWDSIEKSAGVYDFTGVFDPYKKVHRYGESIYGAVNVAFSAVVKPGANTIPSFYPDSITNPVTNLAAKKFVKAYVKEALRELGTLTLTIDYEIVSNYRLYEPGSETRASQWADWYVEAVTAARNAAASIGMADKLKLMPIVNGDPLDPTNPIHLGPSHNSWLVRVVDTSDFLALDTYQSDSQYVANSPQCTFDIIKFWTDSFSGRRDVIVTENGFNTVTQKYDTIHREDRKWKTTGTEADQDTFYTALFAQLGGKNRDTGIYHNKLRSYNMWSIADNTDKDTSDEDYYFGIVGIRSDGSKYEKPALKHVQQGYAALEADSYHQPYTITMGTTVTGTLDSGTGNVPLVYSNGDHFDFLRYHMDTLPHYGNHKHFLHIKTTDTGSIILNINGNWLYYGDSLNLNVNISDYCTEDSAFTMDVYFTNDSFPYPQHVKLLEITNQNTPSHRDEQAGSMTATGQQEVNIYPNPVTNTLYISGLANTDFAAEIVDATGKVMWTGKNTSRINTAALSPGSYIISIHQGGQVITRQFIKQ